MGDSQFREYFKQLRGPQRRQFEWPQPPRQLIEQEFERIRRDGQPYTGPNVFLDRDERAWGYQNASNHTDEEQLVYSLYREVHEKRGGLLDVGGEATWLVTCQVPNQVNHRSRRADLLGLRANGSLVVFECKVAKGKDSPLIAILEGLDYLSHILLPKNMESLESGYRRWRDKARTEGHGSVVPPAFAKIDIDAQALHSVVVLAPPEYYESHSKDSKEIEQDWHLLSDRCWPRPHPSVGIDFAVTDFKSGECRMLELPCRPRGAGVDPPAVEK